MIPDRGLFCSVPKITISDLRKSKSHIQQKEVKFHGHIFTKDGLKTDPEKIRAVVEMPKCTNKASVLRLLVMVNYATKFIPNMSDLTALLRQLLHQYNFTILY